MKYTLAVIFSADLRYVLMLERNKEPFKGMLNGVGGKIDPTLDELYFAEHLVDGAALRCIKREITEETGHSFSLDAIHHLVTLHFPSNTTLYCYYCISDTIPDNTYVGECPEGSLYWVARNTLMNAGRSDVAGEGIIAYLINCALIHHMNSAVNGGVRNNGC